MVLFCHNLQSSLWFRCNQFKPDFQNYSSWVLAKNTRTQTFPLKTTLDVQTEQQQGHPWKNKCLITTAREAAAGDYSETLQQKKKMLHPKISFANLHARFLRVPFRLFRTREKEEIVRISCRVMRRV